MISVPFRLLFGRLEPNTHESKCVGNQEADPGEDKHRGNTVSQDHKAAYAFMPEYAVHLIGGLLFRVEVNERGTKSNSKKEQNRAVQPGVMKVTHRGYSRIN